MILKKCLFYFTRRTYSKLKTTIQCTSLFLKWRKQKSLVKQCILVVHSWLCVCLCVGVRSVSVGCWTSGTSGWPACVSHHHCRVHHCHHRNRGDQQRGNHNHLPPHPFSSGRSTLTLVRLALIVLCQQIGIQHLELVTLLPSCVSGYRQKPSRWTHSTSWSPPHCAPPTPSFSQCPTHPMPSCSAMDTWLSWTWWEEHQRQEKVINLQLL